MSRMSDIRTFIKEIYQLFTKSLIHVTYYCQVGPCFDFKFLSAITSVRPHWDQIRHSNENTAVISFILSVGSAFRLRRCRPQGFPKQKQQTNNKKAQRPWSDHLKQTQLLEKRNPISLCADQSDNQVISPAGQQYCCSGRLQQVSMMSFGAINIIVLPGNCTSIMDWYSPSCVLLHRCTTLH